MVSADHVRGAVGHGPGDCAQETVGDLTVTLIWWGG